MDERKTATKILLWLFLEEKYENIRKIAEEAGYEGAWTKDLFDVGAWLIEFFMAVPEQKEKYDQWLKAHATLMAI